MASGYDLPPETPGFAQAQAEMSARSKPAANLPGARVDLAYGPDPRHRLDVFPAGPGAPVLLFLRGGYWRVGEKEDRWFPALEWLPRGVSWVVPNYRLAPAASLSDIVADASAALRWVLDHGAAQGLDPDHVHLVGNSAGAHLAAMAAAGPLGARVRSMTLISGLFDLLPLLGEEANTWLNLDADAAKALSPIHRLPPKEIPASIICGAAESEAFRQQSQAFAQRLHAQGTAVTHLESTGKNHMEIILECGIPGTPVFEALLQHLNATLSSGYSVSRKT